MQEFKARLGTVFRWKADLTGEVYIQFSESASSLARVRYVGNVVTTVQVPLEDLMEFAAHISNVPETPEGLNELAAAAVMEQLRQLGVFERVTQEKQDTARELFLVLFSGKQPGLAPLDAYDRETKALASAHVGSCFACDEVRRCAEYWRILLDRTQAKDRRSLQ